MKFQFTLRSICATALLSLASLSAAGAQITVDSFFSWVTNGGTNTFDASGSDKLVVVVAGEHNFNQSANGQISNVTYDGQELTKAVDVDPVKIDDGGHGDTAADIWYLDNPGDFHTAGTVLVTVSGNGNNYVYTVMGLSGTAEGVGAIVAAPGAFSADLTTTASDSLVVFTIGTGGGGNTANPVPSANSPVGSVTVAQQTAGNGWAGHAVAHATVALPGLQTFSFDTTKTDVATVAAEFLSADGTGPQPFAITGINYVPDATPNPTVTLTWRKTGAPSYIARISRDLSTWLEDLDDSITPDRDESPGDAEQMTVTFDLTGGLENDPDLFFRIEEG